MPTPNLADIFALIADVPFEPAMLLGSLVAAEVYHHPLDRQRQLTLAAELYPPTLATRVQRFLEEDPSHLVFDLRHLLALQRLLIVHAAPDPVPVRGLTLDETHRVVAALVGLAGALPTSEPPDQEDGAEPDWHGWTRFFAQTGTWYGDPYVLEAVARTFAYFSQIAASDELASHPARADIDERLRQMYGLGLTEQLGAGLACAVMSKAVAAEVDVGERAIHLEPGFLANGPLASREPEVVELISATREELARGLADAGGGASHIAWDHSVLERFPFLRLPDGNLRLLSPRALVAWMTRGLHYRLLDASGRDLAPAEADKSRGLFLTFAGALGESYVRRLVGASLKTAGEAGAVRVHGEVEFHIARRRLDGPDIVIDAGPDLIPIEVYSGRMSLEARTEASSSALDQFVKRATADKLSELAARIQNMLAGELQYEDLQLERVRRIYPVLVLAGDPVAQTPLVWGHIRSTSPEAFLDDVRVQRPIILDLDDLEPLLALCEEGHHLPELLAEFLQSDYAEMPPRNWLGATHGVKRRPSFVVDQYRAAMSAARYRLFPNT
jgi:hypothetical protein